MNNQVGINNIMKKKKLIYKNYTIQITLIK